MAKKRSLSLNSVAWKRFRAEVLAEEPLCRMCSACGVVEPATEVDHIKDSRDDYTDDNRRENVQPLCKSHHSLKTARSMGKNVFLGCDERGFPLDSEHAWFYASH